MVFDSFMISRLNLGCSPELCLHKNVVMTSFYHDGKVPCSEFGCDNSKTKFKATKYFNKVSCVFFSL